MHLNLNTSESTNNAMETVTHYYSENVNFMITSFDALGTKTALPLTLGLENTTFA